MQPVFINATLFTYQITFGQRLAGLRSFAFCQMLQFWAESVGDVLQSQKLSACKHWSYLMHEEGAPFHCVSALNSSLYLHAVLSDAQEAHARTHKTDALFLIDKVKHRKIYCTQCAIIYTSAVIYTDKRLRCNVHTGTDTHKCIQTNTHTGNSEGGWWPWWPKDLMWQTIRRAQFTSASIEWLNKDTQCTHMHLCTLCPSYYTTDKYFKQSFKELCIEWCVLSHLKRKQTTTTRFDEYYVLSSVRTFL